MLGFPNTKAGLFVEWPQSEDPSQALQRATQALAQHTSLRPIAPLPDERALVDALSEDEPTQQVEVLFEGSGLTPAAMLSVVTGERLPLWCPHRLEIRLDPSVSGARAEEAKEVLISLGRALACTFAAIVTNYGASLYPGSSLDVGGRPILGWVTMLDHTQYPRPSQGTALDERHWLLQLPPPWDFDNRASRRRYEALANETLDWSSVAYPKYLQQALSTFERQAEGSG